MPTVELKKKQSIYHIGSFMKTTYFMHYFKGVFKKQL
jgi:hypothetical protein